MRKMLVTLLTGVMLMVATSAIALTIGSGPTAIEVGEIDFLMAYKVLDISSTASENAWAAPIVYAMDGVFVNFTLQTDTERTDWKETNQAGVYAYALSGIQDYFILKTGNLWKDNSKTNKNHPVVDPAPPEENQYEHFLYRNNIQDAWAVVDLAGMFGGNLNEFLNNFDVNNGKISHVTTGDSNTPVPEPGTMMLLGVGVFGLAIFGKRRMNK